LLDWAVYMQAARTAPDEVDLDHVPFPGTLVKQRNDQVRLRTQAPRR
jgi:hypothetical protein